MLAFFSQTHWLILSQNAHSVDTLKILKYMYRLILYRYHTILTNSDI